MRAGALEAALSPAAGGSLLWLRHGGEDVLRPAPGDCHDPLGMASFPLVPYANRIANGRFGFDGRDYQLPRNFGDHPHSIHGTGWQAAWTVADQGADAVRLVQDHARGAAWPWPYRAEQHVALRPDAIDMRLTLTNIGDAPMPAGLGFHPYFLADAGTQLRFAATSLWLSTPDMLPDREVAADMLGDWSRGARVMGDTLIDNVYGGWDGRAIIARGDGMRIVVTASGADWLHVYRPPNSVDFCIEPVSHCPDAINRADGMTVLAPGAATQLSMTIRIDK
ncbi:epimerase [Sphingobium sp. AEW4]|nr:epimerase [Sphingobium sp. AEW4]